MLVLQIRKYICCQRNNRNLLFQSQPLITVEIDAQKILKSQNLNKTDLFPTNYITSCLVIITKFRKKNTNKLYILYTLLVPKQSFLHHSIEFTEQLIYDIQSLQMQERSFCHYMVIEKECQVVMKRETFLLLQCLSICKISLLAELNFYLIN